MASPHWSFLGVLPKNEASPSFIFLRFESSSPSSSPAPAADPPSCSSTLGSTGGFAQKFPASANSFRFRQKLSIQTAVPALGTGLCSDNPACREDLTCLSSNTDCTIEGQGAHNRATVGQRDGVGRRRCFHCNDACPAVHSRRYWIARHRRLSSLHRFLPLVLQQACHPFALLLHHSSMFQVAQKSPPSNKVKDTIYNEVTPHPPRNVTATFGGVAH